jgi:flagellar hook-length control protein FliK
MSNGQIKSASMPTAVALVSQEPTVSAAVTLDGVQQDGGSFAGLLNGIQSVAKMKDSPDSGQAEQPMARVGEDQLSRDAGAENPAVDMLVLLDASRQIISASEPAVPKQEALKEANGCTDVAPQGGDPTDVMSQMAMAAYSQPGRMPEVTIPTPLPVDMLQKVVAAVVEQPTERQSTALSVALAAEKQQHHQSEAVQLPSAVGHPVKNVDTEPVQAGAFQPVENDTMSGVTIPTPLPVDRLQNVASSTDQPVLFSVPPDKIQQKSAETVPVQAVPVQTPVVLSAVTAPLPTPDKPIAPPGAISADLTAIPTVKTAAVVPTSSPESEIEIHLSQPRPITARVTANARQQLNPEQQIDKVRSGNEQSAVKEMASSLQIAASDSESTLGSGTSRGSSNNQEQPDVASDNQTLTQDMRGQLRAEQQRTTVSTPKAVLTEPLRQDVPEQVVQQVKERLVQHDVKPGNQQITLTLSPDTLGELKMNLNLQGQKLSVEIVTENRTVRDAIIQHTDALKESLARQNITMESFDVTTGGKGPGNQGQNQSAWRELAKQQQHQQLWTSPRGYQTARADLPSDSAAYQGQQGQTMLDIHY